VYIEHERFHPFEQKPVLWPEVISMIREIPDVSQHFESANSEAFTPTQKRSIDW